MKGNQQKPDTSGFTWHIALGVLLLGAGSGLVAYSMSLTAGDAAEYANYYSTAALFLVLLGMICLRAGWKSSTFRSSDAGKHQFSRRKDTLEQQMKQKHHEEVRRERNAYATERQEKREADKVAAGRVDEDALEKPEPEVKKASEVKARREALRKAEKEALTKARQQAQRKAKEAAAQQEAKQKERVLKPVVGKPAPPSPAQLPPKMQLEQIFSGKNLGDVMDNVERLFLGQKKQNPSQGHTNIVRNVAIFVSMLAVIALFNGGIVTALILGFIAKVAFQHSSGSKEKGKSKSKPNRLSIQQSHEKSDESTSRKEEIITELLHSFDPALRFSEESSLRIDELNGVGLFAHDITGLEAEDSIDGSYQGVSICCSEIRASFYELNQRNQVPPFNGLVFRVPLTKSIYGRVFVTTREDNSAVVDTQNGLRRVYLRHLPKFSEHFNVFTKEDAAVGKLLNESVCELLLTLYTTFGGDVVASLGGTAGYIAIGTNSNFFEPIDDAYGGHGVKSRDGLLEEISIVLQTSKFLAFNKIFKMGTFDPDAGKRASV